MKLTIGASTEAIFFKNGGGSPNEDKKGSVNNRLCPSTLQSKYLVVKNLETLPQTHNQSAIVNIVART